MTIQGSTPKIAKNTSNTSEPPEPLTISLVISGGMPEILEDIWQKLLHSFTSLIPIGY